MTAWTIALAIISVLLAGCGGSESVGTRGAPNPASAHEAELLLNRAVHAKDAHCAHRRRDGAWACELPAEWARVDLRLTAAGDGYAIEGCEHPTHSCVFDRTAAASRRARPESDLESSAAADLEGIGLLTDVSCSRRARHRFDCQSYLPEPPIEIGLDFGVTIDRRGLPLLGYCRFTTFPPGASAFACQHKLWDIGHMEAMEEGMALGKTPP